MSSSKAKHLKALWIVLGVIAVVIALAILVQRGLAIPAGTTDGTEKYTGVKLEVAQRALEFDQDFNSDYPLRYKTKAQVVDVKPVPLSEKPEESPLRCTDDPNVPYYYSVTIKRIGLFGLYDEPTTYYGCNLGY